jgi:hypothetical protein
MWPGSVGGQHTGTALASRCGRWGQSQILQLAPHFVVGGQGVEICLHPKHRQHAQISA